MANKLVIACPPECSLHPDKIGADKAEALLSLREAGLGQLRFQRQAAAILGRTIAGGTAGRHLRHYRESEPDHPAEAVEGRKVGDLEILDAIISAGARNSRNWKPTIKDTLDAMKLKLQITGNSAFEDMLAAMDAGLDLAEGIDVDGLPENPAALGTSDEINEDGPEE